MKKLILLSAIVLSGLTAKQASAQIGIRFNLNFGPRPVVVEQQPVYDGDGGYYYLPDVQAYYSPDRRCYFYNDGYNWVSAQYLPGRYHDYDWQHARRYAINEPRPYLHDDVYRTRYSGFNGRMDWDRRGGHDDRAFASRGRDDNRGYGHDEGRNYSHDGDRQFNQHDDRGNHNEDHGRAYPQHDNRDNDSRGGQWNRR